MRALHSFLSGALGNAARKADKGKWGGCSPGLAHIKPFVFCSLLRKSTWGCCSPKIWGERQQRGAELNCTAEPRCFP